MLGRRRRGVALAALAAATVAVAGVAVAYETIDAPVTATARADRVTEPLGDVVSIFDVEEVDREVVEATFRIAQKSGAAASTARTGSVGMFRVERDGATIHAAPDGYLIPLVFLALPPAGAAGVTGTDVSAALKSNTVVMNEMTATQTGAQVGDTVVARSLSGGAVRYRIAAIKPYDQLGGSEVVMSYAAVERLGVVQDTQTVIWSIASRDKLDAAVAAEGLESRKDTRVSRSWSAASPDDTLSTARTKEALGEPWYRIVSDTTLAMHPTWIANNLTAGRILLDPAIPVRAQCHVRIVDDLKAALAEVAGAGLGWAIDVGNTNTYGGCFNPRYNRLGGFLSRHAYAQAIDMNTVTNCQGCVPRMDCRVVQIFRKHGFAWGGNFRRPDGMHFEWVGERRDQLTYPSKYCPNVAGATGQTQSGNGAGEQRGRDVLVDSVEAAAEHE